MNALQVWKDRHFANNQGCECGDECYIPPPFWFHLIEHYESLGQKKTANERAGKLTEMLQKIDVETLQSFIYHQSSQRNQINWEKKREGIIEGLRQYRRVKAGKAWVTDVRFVSAFIQASCIAYQLRVGKIERYMPYNSDKVDEYEIPPYELTTNLNPIQEWKRWINWFLIQSPSFEFEKHPKEEMKWLQFEKELPEYISEVLNLVRGNRSNLALNQKIRAKDLIK